MEIKFSIEFVSNEKELLKSILQCDSDEDLNFKLNKIARSAFEENRKMIVGQKIFTRGRDLLEYRLFNLIIYYFDGIIPNEQNICDLFQITSSESRSFIRSIMSKYQYNLKKTIDNTLKNLIEEDVNEDDNNIFKVSIQNQFFKDELNRILGTIDPSLPMIEKERGTVATYIVPRSSYFNLGRYFGIENEGDE